RQQVGTRLRPRAPKKLISIEEKTPLAFPVVLRTISFLGLSELPIGPKQIPDPSRTTRGRATRPCRGARQRVSRRGRTPPGVPPRRLFALGDRASLRPPEINRMGKSHAMVVEPIARWRPSSSGRGRARCPSP